MTYFVAGLLVFLGVHSVRIVADDWRTAQVARMGERTWKAVYSVISIAGFVLMVWGYGMARQTSVDLWSPPAWTHYAAAVLTLPAFILTVAAYVRGTHIKAAVGHPMMLGVKLWAFAHLLSNGRLADVLLFGAFLIWSASGFMAARSRDRARGVTYPSLGPARDLIAIAIGVAAWAAFAFYLHAPLVGVRPFP